MIAKISPLLRLPSTADVFDYFVPPDLEAQIKLGQLVAIPWRTEEAVGVVLELTPSNSPLVRGRDEERSFRARPIRKIINSEPILTPAQLVLIKKFSSHYFCPPGAVARLVIPEAPERTIIKAVKITAPWQIKFEKPQLTALAEAAKLINNETRHIIVRDFSSFIWLIFYFLESKSACPPKPWRRRGSLVILFPTIDILEATQAILEKKYGQSLTVIHSQLSKGAYWRAYQSILKAEAKIILSTRQGVFLPIPEQSKIIFWNASSDDFKQTDQHPRYDARLAATWQAKATNSQLISTAPNPLLFACPPEWREEGEGGGVIVLPTASLYKTETKIINMKKEFALKDFSVISEQTIEAINEALEEKKQVVIIGLKNDFKVKAALTKRLENVKNIIVATPNWLMSGPARLWRGQIGCLIISSIEPLLALPDYRASERVLYRLQEWKLWAQELLIPTIILQSYQAESAVMRAFVHGEIEEYRAAELKLRQSLEYPPFGDLIKISFKGADQVELMRVLTKLKETGAKVLGPYKEYKTKRESFLLKIKNNIDIPLLATLPAKVWAVDRDPEMVL
mgnify:CR=1 FL=1